MKPTHVHARSFTPSHVSVIQLLTTDLMAWQVLDFRKIKLKVVNLTLPHDHSVPSLFCRNLLWHACGSMTMPCYVLYYPKKFIGNAA